MPHDESVAGALPERVPRVEIIDEFNTNAAKRTRDCL